MAAAAATEPAFDLDSFNEEDPQAFYLWERREEMEAMADACLVVEGMRLPVHTQVLSLASGVLCRLFADMQSARLQDLTIEAPFTGFSVQDVALFLRLLYDQCWRSGVAAAFNTLHDNLAALLRLAHQLEAQQLLGALQFHMTECSTVRPYLLMDWLEAAEACQLDALRTSCLLRLARSLGGWGDNLAASLAHASLLERCDKRTLTQLVGLLAAAGKRRTGSQQLAAAVPAATEVESALAEAANPGTFSWTLERFSQQPPGTDDLVLSPEFKAAGLTWQLRVYPGSTAADEGFVSVYCDCKSCGNGVCAHYAVQVLDVNGAAQITKQLRSSGRMFWRRTRKWGFDQFASREELTRKGLLEGDSLRLRVTLTLLP